MFGNRKMLAFIAVVLSVSLLGISSVYASDINGGQKKGILETVTDGVTGFVKNSAKGLANFKDDAKDDGTDCLVFHYRDTKDRQGIHIAGNVCRKY